MDMALDDIIKQTKPSGGRRGGSSGRGGVKSRGAASGGRVRNFGQRRGGAFQNGGGALPRSRGTPEGRWTHDRFSEGGIQRNFGLRSGSSSASDTSKLLISNLDFGVSDSDIKELFGEFGALRRAAVHYDKTARSLGSADVVFERRSDALRALKQYNGVPLDGRPMKIQLVTATTNGASANTTNFNNNRMRGFSGGRRESSRGNSGRARGGGRGRGRDEKKPVTQEQLDADLDAYINKA